MNDMKFNKLLGVAARHAARAQEISKKVNDECLRRYGVMYSDVDADNIIDTLDYLGGFDFTVEEFHQDMTRCGAARIDI